jgi:DNA primase small subunit
MDAFSQAFVSQKFSEYYTRSSNALSSPEALSQRELAFFLFKERIMVRHRSASNLNGLRRLIGDLQPSDIYYSSAYYENPEADMDKKGWQGADLVFDIDADHIPTSCEKIHDEWTCGKCGFKGRGPTPDNCPACSAEKFDTKSWPCERCINSARDETVKLIDMLEKDFGMAESDIRVFFSGHRGYHVHVETEAVRSLDSVARKEIVDYVYGIGLTGFDERPNGKGKKKVADRVFSLHDFGWNKRIKLGMRKFILNATKEDFNAIGIKRAEPILRNKEAIANRYIEENRWNLAKGVGAETWTKLAIHVKDLESAKIDTVVTTDIHRLIRMNGTLHGKSGLLKVEFPVKHLADFDPFKEAVAFKEGTAKVNVSNAPQFRLGEDTFGPYEKQEVELPTAVAVLLICKGRAEAVKT